MLVTEAKASISERERDGVCAPYTISVGTGRPPRQVEKFGSCVHQAAAQALRLSLWPVGIGAADEIEPALAKMVQDGANGVAFSQGSLLFSLRAWTGAALLSHKLPGISHVAEQVPSGLLLSYGQDFPDFFRRAATYVDKILKGAKPADLPVEQPTKFQAGYKSQDCKSARYYPSSDAEVIV
jgi:ABC transporter substrate binding protein